MYAVLGEKTLTLNSSQSNTTSRGMNKDGISLLDTRPHDQRAVARRCGDKQARGILVRPALGHGQQRRLGRADLGGKGALRGAKDAGADGEARRRRRAGGRGENCACEFGAGDPGEGCVTVLVSFAFIQSKNRRRDTGGQRTRLVLVFALDLQNVKKVGGGGMDLDQVLAGLGLGVGQIRDFEVSRALRRGNTLVPF